jgi:hypothetical protein
MPLIPLELPPGAYRNGTEFDQSGRWRDVNLVRWRDGSLRPVGGWRLRAATAYTGVPRGVIAWEDLSGDRRVGVGSFSNLYSTSASGTTTDITPAGFTSGSEIAAVNTGFGGGFFGTGYFGTARPDTGNFAEATTWSLDNWGEYLVACSNTDGKIYEWQLDIATAAAAVANAPVNNLSMMVTAERFMFALGAGGNPRLVQWSDRENNTLWTAADTNEAGDIELQTAGQIMCGINVRGQALILTDQDAHSATYEGPPYVYRIERVGQSCGIMSRKALATVDAGAFWMGQEGFFSYAGGAVQEIPCDVSDYVFGDINRSQSSLVHAVQMSQHGEIWWFYPSGASNECDRYVSLDYKEGHWTFGEIDRTCGVARGVFKYPLWADSLGNLWEQEVGLNYGGASIFAESGPISLGVGDQVMSATGMIPDEITQGDVTATFKTRFYPNGDEQTHGPYSMANPTDVRFTGRQIRMRVDGARLANWRVGTMRLDVTPGGRR